jgi:hypothetical protein
LHLNRNRHAIYVSAHVGAIRSERTLQSNIADARIVFQCLKNLHLAPAVFTAFIFRIPARERIFMGEIINP